MINYAELELTEACSCVDEGYGADSLCERCKGRGEVLTENGKTLISFVRKHLFTEE